MDNKRINRKIDKNPAVEHTLNDRDLHAREVYNYIKIHPSRIFFILFPMPAYLRRVLCLTGLLFLYACSMAQTLQPYILNGSATQRSCNCYVLTEDVGSASGTVWNKNKIDLSQSFNLCF